MLDLTRLEKVRERGAKVIARCPACAEVGSDRSAEHLAILGHGRGPFACIAFSGAEGASHRRRIYELAGATSQRSAPRLRSPAPAAVITRAPRSLALPPLSRPTIAEMADIALRRGWPSFAGLELLSRRGILWMANVYDGGATHRAWIVTDSSRRHAQARRLDGRPWEGIGRAKAKTLPGSVAAWPIGAREVGDRPWIVLCEGQPDLAASLLVAWWEGANVDEIAPVCMAGTGAAIASEALPIFSGKNVLIPQHNDPNCAGAIAAAKWATQLYEAGAARVEGFDFASVLQPNGLGCKDLADYSRLLATCDNSPTTSCSGSGLFSALK